MDRPAVPTVVIHPSRDRSPVRPLNGVNGGGVISNYRNDLVGWYGRWQVPVIRLHDVPFDAYDTVDLHHLFPNPDADPDDPASYDFTLTDSHLEHLRDSGAELYFRLGESIEHQPRLRWNRHDRWDPQALARVCANIVRHYNHGWADGHEWAIQWWEFWNEPHGPKNWDGTVAEFFQRYQLAVSAIKEAAPEVKVGLAGFAALIGDPERDGGWGAGLAEMVARGAEVDFVSWHQYPATWTDMARAAHSVRAFLDRIGLAEAESHLGEWSYNPRDAVGEGIFHAYRQQRDDRVARYTATMQGPAGLAHTLGGLILLQRLPVDQAHYYSGTGSPRWGLFDGSGVVSPRGLAFEIFGALRHRAVTDLLISVDSDHDEVEAMVMDAPGGGLQVAIAVLTDTVSQVSLQVVDVGAATPYAMVDRFRVWDTVAALAVAEPAVQIDDDLVRVTVPLVGPGVVTFELVRGEPVDRETVVDQEGRASGPGPSGDW